MSAVMLLAAVVAGFYLGLVAMSLFVIAALGDTPAPPPSPPLPPIPEEKVW